jgi:hypothetical protein
MSQARPPDDKAARFEDSPIAWFGEMLIAWDEGDIDRAAEAKRRLAALGWHVQYRKPRRAAEARGVGQ